MGVLSVKFGILAGLFGVIGLIGLAALLGSVIWLIIRVASFDSMLPALLCVALSLALTAGGMLLTPAPEVVRMEPLKAPWTVVLERIAQLRDRKDDDSEDGAGSEDDSAGDDGPEHTALKEDGAAPESGPPAQAEAEPTGLSPAGHVIEAWFSGWDVRITIPAEWEKICTYVIERNYIAFYQRAASENFEEPWLFSVYLWDPLPDGLLEAEARYQIVAQEGDAALLSLIRSDLPEHNSFLDEYLEMRAAIPDILETVKLEKA